MTSDEIKQAADELMRSALCGSKTGRPDYIHVVENDKLYRWHQAMQALLFQSQHGTWQPFTTAPTDGTKIVVYRQDAGVFTAHYHPSLTEDGEWDDENCCWFTVEGEDLTKELPTHWMPLPAGPDDRPQQPQQVVPTGHVVVPVEVVADAALAVGRVMLEFASAAKSTGHLTPQHISHVNKGADEWRRVYDALRATLERRPTP